MFTRVLGPMTALVSAAGLAWAQPAPPAGQQQPAATPAPQQQQPQAPARATAAQPGQQQQQQGAAAAPTTQQAAANGKPAVDLKDYHSGPSYQGWLTADYLFWWTRDNPVPVTLATTGPAGSRGVLGAPGTATVFGNNPVDYGTLSGGRLEGGTWLNCKHTLGLEGGFFILEQGASNFAVNSNAAGSPVLARPFVNAVTGVPSSVLVAAPGLFAGGIATATDSQLWGWETNFVRNICCDGCSGSTFDLLLGVRALYLNESLDVDSVSTALAGGAIPFAGPAGAPGSIGSLVLGPGGSVEVRDHFGARNRFYGGQVGARTHLVRGAFFLDLTGKVAIGPNHEEVNVIGNTTAVAPGFRATTPGGLLALNNANFGRFRATDDFFTVVPEARAQVGCQLSQRLAVHAGYTFLYVSDVARPGNQVSPIINPGFVPTSGSFGSPTGPVAPTLNIRQDNFWAQGFNVGMTFRY